MIIGSSEGSDAFFVIGLITITYQQTRPRPPRQRTPPTSRKHHIRNIRPEVEPETPLFGQKPSKEPSPPRLNSNHLPPSRILQNSTYFTSNSTVLSYLLDSFNTQSRSSGIDSDTKSRSPHISIQHINIEAILFAWEPARKHTHRPTKFVFLSHSPSELGITSEGRYHLEFRGPQYPRYLNTETTYLFWEHFQNIPVFLTDRPYSLASAVTSVSIRKVVQILTNVWYCNHHPHSRVFQFPTYLPNISAFVSCLGVRLNIKSSTSRTF